MSLISNILIPIVTLWVRSQAEHLEDIRITVGGSSGQILRGHIPYAQVSIKSAIYQGIHITTAELSAQGIHLNVPDLIRGKPLKLLHPIAVEMHAFLDRHAVTQSLESKLCQQVIRDWGITSPPPANDTELTHYLQLLIEHLGDQFQLQELTIDSGAVTCRGIFPIHAT